MRWAALSGTAFVVLVLVAVALFGSGAGGNPAEIAAYYGSHGDRVRQLAGFYTFALGILFLVWFADVLCRTLEAPLVLATGAVTAGLLLAGDALWVATVVTVQHEQGFVLDPSTHLIVEDAGFALFLSGMLVAMAFVATASIAILRTRRLPRSVGWSGFPVAASLAGAWYYLPLFALLAWSLAASLTVFVRSRRRPPAD
jgi:hypothetical protein